MPNALKTSGIESTLAFADVCEPQQMIFDIRSQIEKDQAYLGEKKSTFKTEIDIFEERPELQMYEPTAGQVWYGSIHLIKKSN